MTDIENSKKWIDKMLSDILFRLADMPKKDRNIVADYIMRSMRGVTSEHYSQEFGKDNCI